ncbi:unnamed protein product [Arabidopsis lyrata]|uniref:DUF674 family protein n=1 Tax=Arabidopsis lyrata subsp. lyrata TaxID=81972 RepID=D7M756_ARALL|nr:uncharacterized protein LOC9307011 [Arabidopsis lyrata subsp. lyrata]EFH49284.1 hypothetical protein ARALYDRAFT_486965 [Arabidopsis lyrata subsp. lyrata]CAH8269739.1 unnamed protein product [Arabidopsis lyrata]|eukprot:XP_020878838.1 uncharacterized protein LOC9307011 [Arabidopsis lyrata subsp. lyrata]
MAKSSEEPKFTLRLIVDEEKNKVVLAEACRDFVDVLFSLLTLPMGTIVRLLENHRKSEPVTVGCFNNLYRSVVEMSRDSFETEACKQMLMYLRSVRDVQCKRLKLNINPTEDIKCFKCPSYCSLYSNFNTSICSCGNLTNEEIKLENKEKVAGQNQSDANGVFVSGRCSFILTDDLEVAVKSTELVLNKLKSLGCADVSKLGERLLDIGLEEVLTLLECIFSSNAPLTDAFLNKKSPQGVTKFYKSLSPCLEKKEDETEPEKVVTLKAFVRKQDMKILFIECGEEFVELLLSFLAVPLESVWEISGSSISLGCIGNLCRSFSDLKANEGTEVSPSTCVLPSFYNFQMQLPGIITQQPPVYYRYRLNDYRQVSYGLTTNGNRTTYFRKDRIVRVDLMDPKSRGINKSTHGFLKKETKFTVLDDLTITSMNSCSTVCLLKNLQSHADDLEVQVVSISNAEALNLLRASLVTSAALSTALWNLIAKKLKEETDLLSPVSKKVKEET